MADRQEILAQSAKLGQLIGTDPAVKNFRELSRQLELDVGARDLLQQFQQLVEQLSYKEQMGQSISCLLYTSPSPRDRTRSRMPSSA